MSATTMLLTTFLVLSVLIICTNGLHVIANVFLPIVVYSVSINIVTVFRPTILQCLDLDLVTDSTTISTNAMVTTTPSTITTTPSMITTQDTVTCPAGKKLPVVGQHITDIITGNVGN